MKQIVCTVLLGLILSVAPSLYAQELDDESEYYYVSVPIEKIYMHREGYIVLYRVGTHRFASAYIPIEWFADPTGKADLITTGSGSLWPNMTVYYRSGVFSHVRLTVRRDIGHETWMIASQYMDVGDRFKVNEINLEF
jgi:hypothetical protein